MASARARVLIVEDAPSLAETYVEYLKSERYAVEIAETGRLALASLAASPPEVIVLDVNLPDMSGLDVLREVRSSGLPTESIVITAQASVRLAVDAMREGAFDFITKPFSADRLRVTIRNALDRRRLATAVAKIQEETGRDQFCGFIGQSLAMQAVYRVLQNAATSKASVFVTGESGTGKELCADALHKLSRRRDKQFVALNCAAIPRDLLESEIFGHVKGAYTGATGDRLGAAQQADGGTLFLDEVCELDLALQAKMLRFLQTGGVQRVGEDRLRQVDVRIVCATNRDPAAEVAAGRFREDLFYRLHVVPLALPPLRERDDDVLRIATHFLRQFAAEEGKRFKTMSPEAETALLSYNWPGNVRELQNVIRNVVVLHDGDAIDADMLPRALLSAGAPGSRISTTPSTAGARPPVLAAGAREDIEPLEAVVRRAIEAAIAACDGNIPRAAMALRVSPSTLYRRIQAWQAGE